MIKVVIDKEVHNKIMHFVDKSPVECSGLGTVVKEKGQWRVVSAMMLPQKNTGTTTDIEPEDVAKAMYELRNEPGELLFWWHSHVNMGVFWSGTDTDTIHKFAKGGACLATVFNKRGEMKSALSLNNPWKDETIGDTAWWEDLKTIVENPAKPAEVIRAEAAIDEAKKVIDAWCDSIKTPPKPILDLWNEEYDKNVKSTYRSWDNQNKSWDYRKNNPYGQTSMGFQNTGRGSTIPTGGKKNRHRGWNGKDTGTRPPAEIAPGKKKEMALTDPLLDLPVSDNVLDYIVDRFKLDDIGSQDMLPGEPWYDYMTKLWHDKDGNLVGENEAKQWFDEHWDELFDRHDKLFGQQKLYGEMA